MKSKMKYVGTLLILLTFFLLTAVIFRQFPLRRMMVQGEKAWVLSTKCWRSLMPGDLVCNDKGEIVEITEEVTRSWSDVEKTRAWERVLGNTTEGIL